jgi:hypothetical protein
VLAEYYERKFDRLWATFEQLVHTKQLWKKHSGFLQQ